MFTSVDRFDIGQLSAAPVVSKVYRSNGIDEVKTKNRTEVTSSNANEATPDHVL